MGTVFKPIVTRLLPRGAVVEDGVARWRDMHGKPRETRVRETPRGTCIQVQVRRYLARYRDAAGVVRTVATGCRDEAAARAVLVDLERRAELVKAGVLSPAQDAVADHRRASVAHHIDGYVASLSARGCAERHVRSVRKRLSLLFGECQFRSLRDVNRDAVERWLGQGANLRRSARTRNTYAIAAKAFLNWCVETDRLVGNPLARLARADEQADRRRQPRALSEAELARLLDAARRRPLAEALQFNRGWRKGQNGARLRPQTRAKLERLGLERALAYKTLVLTGLRLGELRAIRACDLDGDQIRLAARHAKNREAAVIPIRPDLAAELGRWIALEPGPPDRALFRLSANQVKVFDRDLRFAGIPKRDERGRTVCVHSLRHTFATLMSRGGVAPRVAQAAMRHSTIDLTMQVYTDPRLLDVAAALEMLPELPLEAGSEPARLPA
jgi:integrase